MNYQRFSDELTGDAEPDIFQPISINSVLELQEVNTKRLSGEISDSETNMPQHGNFTVYNEDIEAHQKEGAENYVDDPGRVDTSLSKLATIQNRVQFIVEHIYFRLFTSLIIVLDLILVIVDLALKQCEIGPLQIISLVLLHYFVLEVSARIFYKQKGFFRNALDVVDMIVILVSYVVDITLIAIDRHDSCKTHFTRLVVIGRGVRIARIVRLIYLTFTQKRQVAQATRRVISQNKQRYRKDGFDLDLCYITERVIAMSFPSTGFMSMYRNHIKEVARFLNTKHADHYKVYNLCSEREYDETQFHNRVERISINDHNVPKLSEMLRYTDDVREWMVTDERNIIAVHCKGGKGRTGTMICTWLVDCGLFDEASESLDYFGDRRTDLSLGRQFQGVETPSQSRYVGYYEQLLKKYDRVLPPSRQLTMISIKMQGLSGVGRGDGSDFSVEVHTDDVVIYRACFETDAHCQVMRYQDTDALVARLTDTPVLFGDIKVLFTCSSKSVPKGYDNCPFFFWFHTSFINDNKLKLTREELDNPHKQKTWHVFGKDFGIEVTFADPE